MKFHTVIIIYNPNSTGDSEKNAREFATEITNHDNGLAIKIIATKRAGHAEQIAKKYSTDKNTVIVSSSGDGGYHEVVNGVVGNNGTCTVAVLPSGNANDHHRAVAPDDMVASIIYAKTKRIEAIQVTSTANGKPWTRYAHSYVGFGLTPKVGKVLTDVRPNVITEKWHVLKHAFSFKYVAITSDGTVRNYRSLIVSTIDRMSKVIKLDETSMLNDGLMEVYESIHLSLFGTLKELLALGTTGISRSKRVKSLVLSATKPLLVQLDGEVFTLDKKCNIELVCVKDRIRTLA